MSIESQRKKKVEEFLLRFDLDRSFRSQGAEIPAIPESPARKAGVSGPEAKTRT